MTTPEPNIVVLQCDRDALVEVWREYAKAKAESDGLVSFLIGFEAGAAVLARHRIEAVEAERERCAGIAQGWLDSDFDESANVTAQNIRDDIRSTGKAGA